MSISKGHYLGGVRSVQDVYRRCREDDGCMVWTGYARHGVTPMARALGTTVSVRRFVFEMAKRKLDSNERVITGRGCHPLCCDESHIEAHRGAAYVIELTRRGALNSAAQKAKTGRICRERHAKITPEIVTAWRDIAASSDQPTIRVAEQMAAKEGLTVAHARRVLTGKEWVLQPRAGSVFGYRP